MNVRVETALSAEEQVVLSRLKSFRVPEMARALESQLKDPNADLNTFMERISELIDSIVIQPSSRIYLDALKARLDALYSPSGRKVFSDLT